MGIHKVIEVISQSDESWEDAARKAVADAARTVEGIKTIYIENFQATVEGDGITRWRVNAKITFEIKG